MGEGNDGRWEVQAAFFVFFEYLVFNEESDKKYTTVTPVILTFYMCPQIFITVGSITKKKMRERSRR